MSLFSRLFRHAPSRSPASSPLETASVYSEKASSKPSAADRALAAAAEEKALRSAIDTHDVQAVARLVVAGASTQVRQAAAQAIEDPEVLRQLIREVRGGKDNKVYKILTSKRDARLEQTRHLEQWRAETQAVLQALERHSQLPHDSGYLGNLIQLESRWEGLAAEADPELRNSAQQWIDRSREVIAEHRRQVAAQALQAQAAAHAAAEAQRLRELQAQAAAAVAAEQARVLDEQQRAQAEKQEAEQQAVGQVSQLIRKARAALGDGGSARAASIRRTIEEKLAEAPPLPASLANQLQQLDQQLDALKDWKSFSVTPKRAELIEEMELLLVTSLEPLVLAERIKSLQEEWRTLGKGAGENHEADWNRFQDATQKAYQPCREYFAAQALIREENLRRRDALIAKLTAFEAGHDWMHPDWQAVTNALRETKEEWRRCSPVDRDAAKARQEKFVVVTTSLQGRLDAEHSGNQAQKESLIERARQLLDSDDGRQAAEQVKALQKTWRTVGPVPRDRDQRLWEQFRQHCDAVFQKREQDATAYAAGLENNKSQAIALCEQIERIAALEGLELLTSAAALGELRKAFETLGEFPRADTRALRNRLDRALERYSASIARQQVRDAEHAWNDLFSAANHVRAYRLAVARGLEIEHQDTLKQAAENYMASVQRWPRSGLDALRQALAAERCPDLAANEAALKMLCIRAEVLTDMPTPAEDQALRREYQLQRLVQGMGQRLKADETLDTLAIEWIQVGPVKEAAYEPLLQRFRRCRERGISGGDARH